MRNLYSTLKDADPGLLPALAQVWGVTSAHHTHDELIQALQATMRDPARAEAVWDKLSDEARGALQTILASQGKVQAAFFERLYGDIRKMGRGGIEREKPHLQPATVSEALFYRGLISQTYENSPKGMQAMLYVPADLIPVLPAHKTAYDNIDDEALPLAEPESGAYQLEALPEDALEVQRNADTSLVDDMTTLLAYLRVHRAELVGDELHEADVEALLPFLLKPDEERLVFLLHIGVDGELITVQDGLAYPNRDDLKNWLSVSRARQVRHLAEAWRKGHVYVDLWHVPGLYPEEGGQPYDPVIARQAVLRHLAERVPANDWWSVDEFIELVKALDPDFQRPNGDYDAWYIRNEAGEYLHGFESWDAVEGALIETYLGQSLHWLGLLDLAEDAARFNAYGRAFLGHQPWPDPPDKPEMIQVKPDGTLLASRRVERTDRFQVARFTSWAQLDAEGRYVYVLNAAGLQRAAEQNIGTGQIIAFLKRHAGETGLPPELARRLEAWQGDRSDLVTLEQLLVLRTTTKEMLDAIYNTPTTRKFMGARLGDTAGVIVDTDLDALQTSLSEMGIIAEIRA